MAEGWFRNIRIPMERTRSTAPTTTSRESVNLLPAIVSLGLSMILFDLPVFVLEGLVIFLTLILLLFLCLTAAKCWESIDLKHPPAEGWFRGLQIQKIICKTLILCLPLLFLECYPSSVLPLLIFLVNWFLLSRLLLKAIILARLQLPETGKENKENNEVVKVYTSGGSGYWESMDLEHQLTLKTLAIYTKLKGKISDFLKFVRGKNREEKPLVEFDSTNSSAYQSGLLVSNSEKTNSREESKRPCMKKRIIDVDPTIIISSTDFDAADNIADQGIPTVSYSEMENKREALKRECSGLSLEDLPEHYGGRHEDAMKGLGDSRAWKSFKVHECVPIGEQFIIRILTHGDCGQRKKSQDLPQSLQMVCSGGLAAQSAIRHSLPLQSGSEILGHIALSSSEFTTNNGAHPGRQDQGGSSNNGAHPGRHDQGGFGASRPERERARERNKSEGISREDLEKLFGKKREDAANLLHVSLATFKRICRKHGIDEWPDWRKYRGNSSPSIQPWPNFGSDHVFTPADPNGENNPSPTSNTLSTNGQITMEIEMGGPNSQTNECLRNSFEDPNFQSIGNGSIAEVENPTTFHDSHHGHCRDADFHFPDVYNETEAAGGLGNFLEQVSESSSFMFPVYSDAATPSQPVLTILHTMPHPQVASTQTLRENMGSFQGLRNLLAPQKEPFLEGHVLGSVNCTIGSIFDDASSQPMPTTPHTTGSPEYLRDVLASVAWHRMDKNHYGSSNLINPSCSNLPPSQPLPTIPHITTLPTEWQDSRFVKLDATCGEDLINLYLPLMPGIMELKQAVSVQLGLGLDSFKVKYKDGRGKWILMTHDEDVRELWRLTSSENQDSNRLEVIKVPNNTYFCGNCECDKCRSLKG